MWTQRVSLVALFAVASTVKIGSNIDRLVNDEVKSRGYKVIYGNDEFSVINQVVSDIEKDQILKSEVDLNNALPPLLAEDVKCLMSVDRYCSKEMGEIKSVLIQALKEDCKDCTKDQKEKAGKVVASMMTHDPVAWKTFLTRFAIQNIPNPSKEVPIEESLRYEKLLGEAEEVTNSKYRYIRKGFRVRIKRYADGIS